MMIINLFGLVLIALIIWWFWLYKRERLANYTYVLKFQGNKLSISGSGWHSSSRQAQM